MGVATQSRMPLHGVIFDVDGTLVDSNGAHTDAWVRAFAENGVVVDAKAVRRSIGMGGDKLVPDVSGLQATEGRGRAVTEARARIFRERHLPRLAAFPGARELVAALHRRGLALAVASSAQDDELQPLLEKAGVADLLRQRTSSDDAERSKPDPDIVQAALHKLALPARDVVMIGDTPYDVEAATRAGIGCIAFRCGGWDDDGLSGAIAVYDGPADLLQGLDHSLFGPA